MPTFIYVAKNKEGRTITGREESPNQLFLARTLRKQGYLLISAKAGDGKAGKSWKERITGGKIFTRIPLWEKMIFARHLSVMLRAGLSLNRSLSTLAAQTKNPHFAGAVGDIEKRVKTGQSFADALSFHRDIFNELFINMVRVGEVSGNLVEVLILLADQMKKDNELLNRIRGALYYPAAIIVVMAMVGVAMMIFVVPQLAETFQELQVELPLSTRILIGVGKNLGAHPFVFIVALALFILILIRFLKSRSGNAALERLLITFPVFKDVTIKINSARFSRTLGSLLKGGVPIVQAVTIVSQTLPNTRYRRSLAEAVGVIEKGETLSKSLSSHPDIYPPLVIQMIQVGEETGALSEILEQLAEFYEEEVAVLTKSLSTIIEPVIMVVIGIAVGFFAVSMIQPMYSIIGGM